MVDSKGGLCPIGYFIPWRDLFAVEVGKQSDHVDAADSFSASKNDFSFAYFFLELLDCCNFICRKSPENKNKQFSSRIYRLVVNANLVKEITQVLG